MRGLSVQGARRSAPSGTACRAPTFLNPTLSTVSKRNDVMAGLSPLAAAVQPSPKLSLPPRVLWSVSQHLGRLFM